MAAIGLDDQELEKIAPLCGTLRPANSPDTYAHEYSWTETDLAVVMDHNIPFGLSVNVLAIGAGKPRQNKASQRAGAGLAVVRPKRLIRGPERETRVMMEDHGDCADSCPANAYISLATELSKQLHRTDTLVPVVPPHMRPTGARSEHILIASTSGQPVAIRQVHTWSQGPYIVVLLPPEVTNLSAWFRAFLTDVHNMDTGRVPHPPARLLTPSDWYTPEERRLASRISRTTKKIDRLRADIERLDAALISATEQADVGIRRVLWASGEELEAAVRDILTDLGFHVREMDEELGSGHPKREDLRLTHDTHRGWEAIVEVKGYANSTKTSDTRQIGEQRVRYAAEKGRPPDLTLWVANSYRNRDPTCRPSPDAQVGDSAAAIGAVHILAADLYRLWALVADNRHTATNVADRLIDAIPGCWYPDMLSS